MEEKQELRELLERIDQSARKQAIEDLADVVEPLRVSSMSLTRESDK